MLIFDTADDDDYERMPLSRLEEVDEEDEDDDAGDKDDDDDEGFEVWDSQLVKQVAEAQAEKVRLAKLNQEDKVGESHLLEGICICSSSLGSSHCILS